MKTAPEVLLKNGREVKNTPTILLNVVRWELKRIAASIWSWAAAGVSLLFFLGMVWFKHFWSVPGPNKNLGIVVGTSNFGLLFEYINVLLLVFALFVPFVVTDGIARDYKQRMHEILMATPVPTQVYVWGRFLATSCVSLGLAVLLLIADFGMGLFLSLLNPLIPTPNLGSTILVWAVIIPPATIFLTGVGFSLGTLFPRRSTTLMLALLIGWVLLFVLGNITYQFFNHLFVYLDPTSVGLLYTFYPAFIQNALETLRNVPLDQQARMMLQLQAVSPELSAWVLPHYGVACFGVALVGVVAFSFKRFQDVLN